MELGTAYIDNVTVKERHRSVSQDKVDALAESMAAIGLQNPVHIYAPNDETCELVAGLHRLEAARKLGWESVPCIFIDASDLDRELWEIDENLMRAELTELERADQTARRAEIVREKSELDKLSKTEIPPAERADRGQASFERQTAAATGRDERSIRRDKRRGEKIIPEVKEVIRELPAADIGVELDAIASLEPDEQIQAVERVTTGASETFREARDFIRGDEEDTETERQFKALKSSWLKANEDARKQFTDWLALPHSQMAA